MDAYRGLIDAPGFWEWYMQKTPIEHIGKLPIASRPVSRRASGGLTFEDLRAIPCVFAWTQVSYNVPGWYGLGSGLKKLIGNNPDALDIVQRWFREWTFSIPFLIIPSGVSSNPYCHLRGIFGSS